MSADALLFLDVDGVLNRYAGTTERCDGVLGVEAEKATILRRILKEADCRFVLSSTWRRYPEMKLYLWNQLGPEAAARYLDDTPALVADHTSPPPYARIQRGDEIQAWLDKHPWVNHFVILDDDNDMAHLGPHLVHVNGTYGLTDEIADRVIARLQGEALP